MALTFNGNTSNYAQTAPTFSADKGTVMGWCRIATDRNDYSTFFQVNNTDNQQFVVQTGADGTTLSCYIYDNNVAGAALTVGTWYHVACTWDGSSARIYVNGSLNITNTATGSDWNEIELGRSYWGEPLNGNIAHVKAWNATLSQSEIAAEMYAITAVRTSNLVGEWKTPEGANRLLDTSGNGNYFTGHGTITDYANPLREAAAAITLGAMTVSADGTVTGGTSDINGAAAITLGAMTAAGTIGGVSYIGSATSFSGSGVTSRTCNVPSGTADGDLMLAVVMVELASASVTAHANWGTAILNTPLSTRTHTQVVYARIASSEPANYTFSWSSAECGVAIVTYRNAAMPTLYSSQVNNSSTASCTAPTLTASIDGMLSVWIGTIMYGTTWTPPTNYTERVDQRTSTGGTNMAMGIADYVRASAGATGTVVGTAANADYNVGAHVLLAPYAGPVGTAGITLAAMTLSADGTVASAGTDGAASITLAANTIAAAGTVAVTGAASNTFSAATVSSAGTVAVSGSASITLSAITTSADGTLAISGAAAVTLGALTVDAAGTMLANGAADIALSALTLASTGTVDVTAAADIALVALTLDAAGAVATTNVEGAADITLAAFTLAANGALPVTGAATVTLAAMAADGAGVVPVTGAGSTALTALTASGAGVVAVTGAGAVTLANVGADAAGVVDVTGAASVALGALAITAAGAVAVLATADITLAAVSNDAQGSVGSVPAEGAAAITLAAVTANGAGVVAVAGAADIMLAAVGVESAGTVTVVGVAAVTLGAVTISAAGAVAIAGDGANTLAAVTIDAVGVVAIAGVAALTLAPLNANGDGVLPIVGAGDNTLSAMTVDSAAAVAIVGAGAVTLAALALSADGTAEDAQAIHGEAAITLGALSLSALGVVAFVAIVSRVRGPGGRGGSVVGGNAAGVVTGGAVSSSVTGTGGTGSVRGPRATNKTGA